MKSIPLPPFFDPANAANWAYGPNHQSLLEAAPNWAKQHGIKPAGSDRYKIHLLLIDEQRDFCLPQGTLYVAGRSGKGAVEDSVRVSEFIYRNLGVLTDVTCTMDSHFAFQIFSSAMLVDEHGNHPAPMTQVTTEMVRSGKIRPNPMVASWASNGDYTWLSKQLLHYCDELEKRGKYTLTVWPPHCILGSDGHALVGVIHEARMFHSYVRGAQSNTEIKGAHPLTENYSVLSPEVLTRHDGVKPLAQKNTAFMKKLIDSDVVIIGGQAASHCVASTIDDLLKGILAQDSSLAQKVYIMTDCMSAVVVPSIVDYTADAEAAQKRFSDAGMHLVRSTDPIGTWPGIRL